MSADEFILALGHIFRSADTVVPESLLDERGLTALMIDDISKLEMSECASNLLLIFDKADSDAVRKLETTLKELLLRSEFFDTIRMTKKTACVIRLIGNDWPFIWHVGEEIKVVRCGLKNVTAAVLVHELAHAYCTSGNRFLDEGLAFYAESIHFGVIGGLPFELNQNQLADNLEEYRDSIISLRSAGKYLSDKVSDMAKVYQQSLDAVRFIIDRIGLRRTAMLYEELASIDDGARQFETISRNLSRDT